MKLLKKLLFLVISVIALILIIALFVDKDFTVERKIVIQEHQEDVFNYLKFIKNQDHWSIWQQLDPSMKKYYKGEDGTLGFVYTWSSSNENVGAGEQKITVLNYPDRIETSFHYNEPFEVDNTTYFQLKDIKNTTEVIWGFTGRTPWPFNLKHLFIDMEKEIAPNFEKGLENLKKELEGV